MTEIGNDVRSVIRLVGNRYLDLELDSDSEMRQMFTLSSSSVMKIVRRKYNCQCL